MALSRQHKFITTVFFLTLHMTSSAKTNSRPVYEVINEQSRADDKLITTSDSARLPYGNPLAGNSQKNARLHAHNQQAMFNAERIRQHKAQSQRWMKTPKIIDSYMRAYHESQESHQLALEQQQANVKENQRKPAQHTREFIKRTQKSETDTTKLSKADTVVKPEKMRNQRSYSSVEYQQYLEPNKYQTIYITSPSSYVQGMTIKPNAINAIVHSQQSSKLYGEAISSENVFPKYYPTNDYKSVQDLETLNSLLSKNPGEQLSEFNALIKATKDNTGTHDRELEMPIDLYFYLKDPSHKALSDHYDKTAYAQIPSTQETVKDHIPITEEVDDVENPEEMTKSKVESISTQTPQLHLSTTKDIQYINSELTNQILSAGYNPLQEEQYDIKEHERKPNYEALRYGYQPTAYYSADEDNTEGDLSERYLHHNAKKGVQHLTNDGSGVSAYNDENLHYAANYEFGYRVRDLHSGNDFGHHEAKNGKGTSGHYHVLLPDGRMQNVRYSAGPEGYHADISYDHYK
ncbi:unnamed protein product [Parnassius mnemosyne]|uniref:Pro-resilin n=1 Tax=Parnassius mnemosyne TaxID=213953 RepID=A0AAV1LIT4_9NEOP